MPDLTRARPEPGGSPFDSIRRTRPDGSEYWSARDLMKPLGYERWHNFQSAIERAAAAAKNSGFDNAILLVSEVTDAGNLGDQERFNYELSRYGAYLVALNGDPRKPESALAQAYFVQRTREAESAGAELDELEVAERYVLALREKRSLAARVLELEGPAAHAEAFRHAEDERVIRGVANDFKAYAKTHFPGVKVLHQDVYDHAGRLGIITRGNTVSNNEPTARAIEAGWATPHRVTYETKTRGTQTTVTAHLTPKGEGRLWDGLCAYIHEHGTLTLPTKEIAA